MLSLCNYKLCNEKFSSKLTTGNLWLINIPHNNDFRCIDNSLKTGSQTSAITPICSELPINYMAFAPHSFEADDSQNYSIMPFAQLNLTCI